MKARLKLGLPEAERNWDAGNEAYYTIQRRAPLKTKPGTVYSYNNKCYEMIADIVKMLTKESLDSFARRKIFEPLGMEDTYWVLPESKWSRVVKRDKSFAGAHWLNSEGMLVNASGYSGLKTTMDDLARFGQMFLQNGTFNGNRVLSPASIRMLTTDHNPNLPPSNWHVRILGSNWGFGWNVKAGKKDDLGMLRSDRAYDHGGYGGARLMIDPDHELVLCLYTVEHNDGDPYPYQSRAVNIIYSALD
jgi:CubicO group peptidase (beta-lactamase class C family)